MESVEEEGDFLRVICAFYWAHDCTLIYFVWVFGKKFLHNQAVCLTEILRDFGGFDPAFHFGS